MLFSLICGSIAGGILAAKPQDGLVMAPLRCDLSRFLILLFKPNLGLQTYIFG